MNNLFQPIISFADAHNLLPPGNTIVIGLSGGPDSVFLIHFLHDIQKKFNLTLIAAHLDHEWRADSNKDTLFCKKLCNQLNIPLITQKASALDFKPKYEGSQEAQGRALRRYFLEKVQREYNADYIALAHHKHDQQETFFIRLIRGTTLSGLVGIRPKTKYYIRPLLETDKETILKYLKEKNILYLTDPSNISDRYLRNRIRSKVIPALKECDKRFDVNFLKTIHSLQETEDYLSDLTQQLFESIKIQDNTDIGIKTSLLLSQPEYMQGRLLLYWLILLNVPFIPSNALLKEIKRFLRNKKSKEHQLYKIWTLVKEKEAIYIKRIKP